MARPAPASDPERDQKVARVHELVDQLEARSHGFAMGRFQPLRRRIKGLHGGRNSIFMSDRDRGQDWAFHYGGREELQFNAALDEMPDKTDAFRTGVGFSIEPSQYFNNLNLLLPPMRGFNDWMREHPEAFSDLSMWHFHKGVRSPDRPPGPNLARTGRR